MLLQHHVDIGKDHSVRHGIDLVEVLGKNSPEVEYTNGMTTNQRSYFNRYSNKVQGSLLTLIIGPVQYIIMGHTCTLGHNTRT